MQQKGLSHRIDLKNHQMLLQDITAVRDQARLSSLGIAHSGDWLNAIPSPALGLHLKSQEFQFMCRYRLGIPVFDNEGSCPACKLFSDDLGDHAISCGSEGERIARHNHLRDAVFAIRQKLLKLAPYRLEKYA